MTHPCEIFEYHTDGVPSAEAIQHNLSSMLTTSCTSNQVRSSISRRNHRGGCTSCGCPVEISLPNSTEKNLASILLLLRLPDTTQILQGPFV